MNIKCHKIIKSYPKEGKKPAAWLAEVSLDGGPIQTQMVKTFNGHMGTDFVNGCSIPCKMDEFNGKTSVIMELPKGQTYEPQSGGAPQPSSQPESQPPAATTYREPVGSVGGGRDDAILAQCCFKGAVDILCQKINTICDASFTDKVDAAAVTRLTAELFEGMKGVIAGKRAEAKQDGDNIPF